jgi:hypothetical protein
MVAAHKVDVAILLPLLLLRAPAEEREAISLAPRLQPGDSQTEIGKEPFLTVLVGTSMRNRWKRFKESFCRT